MKILVFGERLDVGGTQVNAIELTAALRDLHGHEVVLFASPGPMVKFAEEKGLRFLPAPDSDVHPSLARAQALRQAILRERPDLIHVWDWTQLLDAYYVAHVRMRLPMVVTVMSMAVPRLLPKALPTTLGTPELLDAARRMGWRRAELILPPVDVRYNAPGVVDRAAFRARWQIKEEDITIVTASRLVDWMKAESLRRTIDVVRMLGRDLPLKFVIVGDGKSRAELEQLGNDTNAALGRDAVVFTGALIDPRPAYAAADIVVGMGGSALRGMAFAKPTMVVGERGFSKLLTPATAESIYYHGIYGIGDGNDANPQLISDIQRLAKQREEILRLGQFSREFVMQNFSLDVISERLENFCQAAVRDLPRVEIAVIDGLRTAGILLGRKLVPDAIRQGLRQQRRSWA